MTNASKLVKINFWKGFGLALEAFSFLLIKFSCLLKIGGDRYRRFM